MQKSQEGLLRSLLYQILKQCPDLTSTVFSERCNEDQESVLDFEIRHWTRVELLRAFDDIAGALASSSKLCLFIDGLDEYSGEHWDLVKVIQHLATCPGVKICISSRPWNVFENAFGKDDKTKIALHEYTKEDIAIYAANILSESPIFVQMIHETPQAWDLVTEIVQKAQGVFLWVFFAIRSLLRGLEDHNQLSTLLKRLDDFPDDLGDFYQRIIHTLDSFYRESTVRILLVLQAAGISTPVRALSFFDLDMEDPEYVFKDKFLATSDEYIVDDNRMATHLKACCKDFVEVSLHHTEESFLRYRVDFVDRSVRDFLGEKDIIETFRARTAADFSPGLYLLKSSLSQVKQLLCDSGTISPSNALAHLVKDCMFYAQRLDREDNSTLVKYLDELEQTLSVERLRWILASQQIEPNESFANLGFFEETNPDYGYKTFLGIAIEHKLGRYVQSKLKRNPKLVEQNDGRSLLSYALFSDGSEKEVWVTSLDLQLVSTLLETGANPNARNVTHNKHTLWAKFLCGLLNLYEPFDKSEGPQAQSDEIKEANYQFIELLLRHGANPSVTIPGSWSIVPGSRKTLSLSGALARLLGEERRGELESRYLPAWQASLWKWVGLDARVAKPLPDT